MNAIQKLKQMTPEQRSKLKWNDPVIQEYAAAVEQKLNLPEGVGRALLFAENNGFKDGTIVASNNDSSVVSASKARGLLQVTDSTMKLRNGEWKHDPLDPVENIYHGLRFFQEILVNEYKDNVKAAFAGYNGGPKQGKAVLEGSSPSAKETQDYLVKAKNWYEGHVSQQPTNVLKNEAPVVAAAPVTPPVEAPAVVATAPQQERVLKYDAGGKRMPSLAEK